MPFPKPLAVITGASSGIGAVYADRLAARGYDLVLIARRLDRLHELGSRLSNRFGIEAEALGADLTDGSEVTRIERLLVAKQGISLLVNNAGNGKFAATLDISRNDVAATIALNVIAPTRLTQAVLPTLLARGAGAIINISSAVALHALPVTSLYSATKSYLLTFSRGLQEELVGTGVKVQVVLPAATETGFFDQAGIPLSAFDPAVVMTSENLVDAALAGFDRGEAVTLPSVHDLQLWKTFEEARLAVFSATQNGRPARRYCSG